jgi:SAM-dependent MidA family methyltransferase
MQSNSALRDVINQRIIESPQKRITFAQYMELALYHLEYGYYSTQAVSIGKEGDFFTSVHLGADFGELLAGQFVQMWEILNQPETFSIVEMGAGQGLLALDILGYLKIQYPDFFAALDYVVVEKSPGLKNEQQKRLQDFSVRWCDLEDIPDNSITGCFFSNELVDALPINRFILQQGQLQEIYVAENPSSTVPYFVEVIDTPSAAVKEYFDLVGIKFDITIYPDEYRSEVNLAALQWQTAIACKLQKGYVLTIDYGYPAHRYYNPIRKQGTLQCYYQHRRHDNPYINVGMQDITAHVDFTALERWGEKCGLSKIAFTQQGLFLMALGLGSRIAAVSYKQQGMQSLLLQRDSLHQLLDPMGLGGFGVLLQCKGLTTEELSQGLKGLTTPAMF